MRPVLAIATRNILPNEHDDRDDEVDDGEDEEEEEEAYLNLLPTGSGTHFPKEKKKNTKKSHRKLDRWRDILFRIPLPQLLHYLVTFFLSLILLSILVLRPRSGAQESEAYVHHSFTHKCSIVSFSISICNLANVHSFKAHLTHDYLLRDLHRSRPPRKPT